MVVYWYGCIISGVDFLGSFFGQGQLELTDTNISRLCMFLKPMHHTATCLVAPFRYTRAITVQDVESPKLFHILELSGYNLQRFSLQVFLKARCPKTSLGQMHVAAAWRTCGLGTFWQISVKQVFQIASPCEAAKVGSFWFWSQPLLSRESLDNQWFITFQPSGILLLW